MIAICIYLQKLNFDFLPFFSQAFFFQERQKEGGGGERKKNYKKQEEKNGKFNFNEN